MSMFPSSLLLVGLNNILGCHPLLIEQSPQLTSSSHMCVTGLQQYQQCTKQSKHAAPSFVPRLRASSHTLCSWAFVTAISMSCAVRPPSGFASMRLNISVTVKQAAEHKLMGGASRD